MQDDITTVQNFENLWVGGNTFTIDKFCRRFGDYDLSDLSVAHILDFLNQLTADRKRQKKRTRFSSLLAFFDFAKNNLDTDFTKPCDSLGSTPPTVILIEDRRKIRCDICTLVGVTCDFRGPNLMQV